MGDAHASLNQFDRVADAVRVLDRVDVVRADRVVPVPPLRAVVRGFSAASLPLLLVALLVPPKAAPVSHAEQTTAVALVVLVAADRRTLGRVMADAGNY